MLKGWNSSVRTTSAISSAWMPTFSVSRMLAQVPVFLGLYHVLMSFNRTQTGIGRLGLSAGAA